MAFGKYSRMIQNSGDALIGTEITVDTRLCEAPMLLATRIDAEGVITLQVNTSDSMHSSTSSETASSNLRNQKHGQSAFKRLLRARSKNRPNASIPKTKLFGSFASARESRVNVGSARELNLSAKCGHSISPHRCAEVLIDRSQKGRWPFFPPSARTRKTAFSGSSVPRTGSNEENMKPTHFEPPCIDASATPRNGAIPWVQQQPFRIGDRVDIVGGEHRGKTGTAVLNMGDRVHVFVDFMNETFSLPLEYVQPHVFIPGQTEQRQVCREVTKRATTLCTKRATTLSASLFSSMQQNFAENARPHPKYFLDSASLLDDDAHNPLTNCPSVIYNISPHHCLREGKVVQVIEGPQRHRVGKILCVTAEVAHVLVDGSTQPCYFSPRMLRDVGKFALC